MNNKLTTTTKTATTSFGVGGSKFPLTFANATAAGPSSRSTTATTMIMNNVGTSTPSFNSFPIGGIINPIFTDPLVQIDEIEATNTERELETFPSPPPPLSSLSYLPKTAAAASKPTTTTTKPETIGPALTDSPIGLAAYILEKFSAWTDPTNVFKPDGGLTEKFTMDELLTNVMIYWFSKNITSSMRFYKENGCPIIGVYHKYRIGAAKVSSTVPAGYAVFPKEMVRVPEFIVRMAFENLVHYTELPSGGHFGAFEEPKLLAEDLRKFAFTVVTKG